LVDQFLQFDTEFVDRQRFYLKEKKYKDKNKMFQVTENRAHNISYPSSAAAVVFGGHLSARAAFRLDRKSPAIRTCV
jgi:D-alanine-D-alanine ligase-like ATP-grasp enzyme